jgi:hypothetical protein
MTLEHFHIEMPHLHFAAVDHPAGMGYTNRG